MNLSNFILLLILLSSNLLIIGQGQFDNSNKNFNNTASDLKNDQVEINQSSGLSQGIDRDQIIDLNSNQQFNQKTDSDADSDEGDFYLAGSTYYIRIILEGIERERATYIPSQRMDGDLYCDDRMRKGLRARTISSYRVTQITVPVDCNNPAVLLNISHWLSVYIYLTSTNRDNPQNVFFKGGDVNQDNLIDDSDLLEILLNFGNEWNHSSSSRTMPDVNLDGVINDKDKRIVLGNFGTYGSVGPANYSIRVYSEDLRNNNNIPGQNLTITTRCSDGRFYNYSNSNYSLGNLITIRDLPYDCNQPQSIISIPHFLSKKVYLINNNEVNINLIYGDTNNDNIIDDSDLLNILFAFGQNSDWRNNPRVDLDFDGSVNEADQNIVLNNFGQRGDNN